MILKLITALIIGAMLTACGGQSGGVAPSPVLNNPPAAVIDVTYEAHMKFGKNQTVNGWQVSLDTTDPVETITLANGWNVEVADEL